MRFSQTQFLIGTPHLHFLTECVQTGSLKVKIHKDKTNATVKF